ncbi:MAG TPA: hypothetical protein VGC72_09940 [Candidatus Elarobacter sp.]
MLSRAVVARLRSRVLRDDEPAGRINKHTSSIIDAALVVLADGRPRTYIEIYTEALKRKLVANVNQKTWYNSISEYVQRRIAGGRDSLIVQDVDRRFRLNHPADDWPDPRGPLPAGRSIPNSAELTALLQKTARGFDPDAFEIAVCRAFEALGYAARHIGGHAAPDGYIDAPLGQLGYRSMLECKTSHDSDVRTPYAAEAAKYKEAYGAQYCSLIVPSFGGDIRLTQELNKHDISAWQVRDLVALLEAGSNPWEMRPLFAAGYVEGRVRDVLWERIHGKPKRVAVICDILLATAHAAQSTALGSPQDAPLLNEDAAMMTVDAALVAQGAHLPCTRDDVRAAFSHLCDPLVGLAVYAGDGRGIVVCAAGSA